MRTSTTRTAIKAFFDGFTSFVNPPQYERSERVKEILERAKGPIDISRYFGIVGQRLTDACAKFEETHPIPQSET